MRKAGEHAFFTLSDPTIVHSYDQNSLLIEVAHLTILVLDVGVLVSAVAVAVALAH